MRCWYKVSPLKCLFQPSILLLSIRMDFFIRPFIYFVPMYLSLNDFVPYCELSVVLAGTNHFSI